ncbi:MAG: hypothetical protein V3V14_14605 [Saprospiraceae bacterium]
MNKQRESLTATSISMKFNVFLILMGLLFLTYTSCSSSNNTEDAKDEIEIALTDTEIVSKFLPWIEKGVRIERMFKNINDEEEFIYAEGVDLEGNFIIARYSKLTGVKESCSGVGCSKCYFPLSGGCGCARSHTSNAYCNHTITQNTE